MVQYWTALDIPVYTRNGGNEAECVSQQLGDGGNAAHDFHDRSLIWNTPEVRAKAVLDTVNPTLQDYGGLGHGLHGGAYGDTIILCKAYHAIKIHTHAFDVTG